MKAFTSAMGASTKLRPILSGQARQRGSAVGDAPQLGAGGGALGRGGGGPLAQRDQRLQRDEAARAVVVGRHQGAGQRARIQLPRPDDRQRRQRRAAHVVSRIAYRLLQQRAGAVGGARRQPAERPRSSRPHGLAARLHRLAQQHEAGLAGIG